MITPRINTRVSATAPNDLVSLEQKIVYPSPSAECGLTPYAATAPNDLVSLEQKIVSQRRVLLTCSSRGYNVSK